MVECACPRAAQQPKACPERCKTLSEFKKGKVQRGTNQTRGLNILAISAPICLNVS